MEFEIKYYPLIDCNDNESLLRPLFPAETEEDIKRSHSLWLMEAIPGSYRLCCTDEGANQLKGKFSIACPLCGKSLNRIGNAINRNRQGLYICESCWR